MIRITTLSFFEQEVSMITIFNRKEIFTTFDLTAYQNVKQLLQQAGIRYRTNFINLNPNYCRTGMTSMQRKYAVQYRIFVHKKDVDKAVHCMHTKSNL